MDGTLALGMTGVTKRFGATAAVQDVSLAIAAGEIVGLVGENGAGKTTLMRIAAGEILADAGEVERPSGVGMVHQHFAIAAELSIAENLALLDRSLFRFTSRRRMEEDAERMIARSGIALRDVSRRAGDLAVGERAKLELIKAISIDPQLLILDEPTSVLTPPEAEELFAVMRTLAARGTAVVFISHKVPEVLEIAKRIVVMRDGRIVADAATMTATEIAEAMVGQQSPLPRAGEGGPKGRVRVLLQTGTLTVHSQEIVAIVGVAGNGQTELAAALRARQLGVRTAFIPEDRTRDALISEMTIAENLALGGERWSPRLAAERAAALISLYRIRATGPRQRTGTLSGGNQQKVVLARELDRRPELIIAAEPTRGLDIASTSFVHDELRKAVAAGAGLLVITSDLDEAFALADVVHVIYRGRLSAPLAPAQAAADIGPLMAGLR
ncbi:MAG TPA: ATP-binding cassette domain-containing protein [Thermoanaerobaculia bacterium]|nr:ATP-binding cassette domain-containing protein [Thermoanaerobaculia bacterium]